MHAFIVISSTLAHFPLILSFIIHQIISMDHFYIPLKRWRRRQQQSSPSLLFIATPSRGVKIRLRRRVARSFHRTMGRASHVLSQWWANLRSGFHRVSPGLGPSPGYVRVAQDKDHVRRAPKGHLVVYVGPSVDGDVATTKRVVVPLIYINHPLFKRLLEDAEEKYGVDYSGGLTIPCNVSEFEMVKTRIAVDWTRKKPFSP